MHAPTAYDLAEASFHCLIFIQSNEVPPVLYDCVVEADERVVLHQESCQLQLDVQTHVGATGEKVYVI